MGCGCRGRSQVVVGGETLGWYVVLPDGSTKPDGFNPDDFGPNAVKPYLSTVEAKAVQRAAGGGSIYRQKKPVHSV